MTKAWPLLLFVIACGGGRRETSQHLNAELNQAIPHLSDPGRVLAVLDSLQIQHSAWDPSTREIKGTVRDSASTLLHRRSIQLVFGFDEQGRLRHRTVRSGS